jgi:hypothetical protein
MREAQLSGHGENKDKELVEVDDDDDVELFSTQTSKAKLKQTAAVTIQLYTAENMKQAESFSQRIANIVPVSPCLYIRLKYEQNLRENYNYSPLPLCTCAQVVIDKHKITQRNKQLLNEKKLEAAKTLFNIDVAALANTDVRTVLKVWFFILFSFSCNTTEYSSYCTSTNNLLLQLSRRLWLELERQYNVRLLHFMCTSLMKVFYGACWKMV